MKGDRVEIVIDAGGDTRTYEIEATRAGRRVDVSHGRGVVEVTETTRGGTPVRTARFMAGAGGRRAAADPGGVSQELVVLVGLQASGKSTWVREHLAGTHAVVSKDHWPHARRREARQRRVVAELLAAGRSVVVDNTNPGPEERAPLVAAARAAGVPVRAVWLDTPWDTAVARNDRREGRARVPLVGLLATRTRLVPPSAAEGFDRVEVVAVRDPERG